MKTKILLRIAAGCILFHTLGHAVGHFTWKDTPDPTKKEVIHQMDEHAFEFMGAVKSIGQHYEGMGLIFLFTLIAMTMIVWTISNLCDLHPSIAAKILIPISLCFLAFSIAEFIYFFPLAAITSLIAGITIGIAVIQLRSQHQ